MRRPAPARAGGREDVGAGERGELHAFDEDPDLLNAREAGEGGDDLRGTGGHARRVAVREHAPEVDRGEAAYDLEAEEREVRGSSETTRPRCSSGDGPARSAPTASAGVEPSRSTAIVLLALQEVHGDGRLGVRRRSGHEHRYEDDEDKPCPATHGGRDCTQMQGLCGARRAAPLRQLSSPRDLEG